MTATDLLVLLTAHFVADFLLQSDWMAINKSKSWWALTVHVFVYTAVVSFIAACNMSGPSLAQVLVYAQWFTIVTFVTHFVTDAITSRITSALWFINLYPRPDFGPDNYGAYPYLGRLCGNRHWFFVVIGFDQLIHAWTLALTWMWIYGR
jgi:hypothetical protein